jgi:predicted 3-demethylubiquinone-9 3-methyltransferase (glyoxalase superfamily)
MTSITPFLWFDDQLEEAMAFYVSLFGDSAVLNVNRLPDGTGGAPGKVMVATFRIAGQEVMGLNGGPVYQLSPAFSFFVSCEDQAEVDRLWAALCADGGQPGECGWLVDRFGVSWQVIPTALGRLMGDPDQERAGRVIQAMLRMKKIEVAELEAAYAGQPPETVSP